MKISESLSVENFKKSQFPQYFKENDFDCSLFHGLNFNRIFFDNLTNNINLDYDLEGYVKQEIEHYLNFFTPKKNKEIIKLRNIILSMDKKQANRFIERMYESQIILKKYPDKSKEELKKLRERQDMVKLFNMVNDIPYYKSTYFKDNLYDFFIQIEKSENGDIVFGQHLEWSNTGSVYVHVYDSTEDNFTLINYLFNAVNGYEDLSKFSKINPEESWKNKKQKFSVNSQSSIDKKKNIELNKKSAMLLMNRFNQVNK